MCFVPGFETPHLPANWGVGIIICSNTGAQWLQHDNNPLLRVQPSKAPPLAPHQAKQKNHRHKFRTRAAYYYIISRYVTCIRAPKILPASTFRTPFSHSKQPRTGACEIHPTLCACSAPTPCLAEPSPPLRF